MPRVLTVMCVCLAASCASVGCGSNLAGVDPGGGAASRSVVSVRSKSETIPNESAVADTGKPELGSSVPGAVTGHVIFDGAVPKPSALVQKGLSSVDRDICAHEGDIPNESLVVSTGGGLANVFVYLDKAPDWYKDKPTISQVLDQKACIFKPHALIAPAGLPFVLKNSDLVAHNIKTEPGINAGTNDTLKPGSEMTMLLKRPERMPFQSKCAIHPWMEFYTLALSHPFAAITDSDGKFEIKDLKPGKYKFRVWHERARGLDPVIVEIKGGESVVLPLKYAAAIFGS